jgi:hypothetical protein
METFLQNTTDRTLTHVEKSGKTTLRPFAGEAESDFLGREFAGIDWLYPLEVREGKRLVWLELS